MGFCSAVASMVPLQGSWLGEAETEGFASSIKNSVSQLLRKLCYIPELGAEVQKIAAGVLVTQ